MADQPHDGRVRIPERYGDSMKVDAPYGSYREAVEMSTCDLGNTAIGPVDLKKARLREACFRGSEVDADSTGANLKDPDFRQAEIEGSFDRADLRGAQTFGVRTSVEPRPSWWPVT
jgi:hypothetical protein